MVEQCCNMCEGTGEVGCSSCMEDGYEECGSCLGEGTVFNEYYDEETGKNVEQEDSCPECDGSGAVDCFYCDGYGEADCPGCEGFGVVEA